MRVDVFKDWRLQKCDPVSKWTMFLIPVASVFLGLFFAGIFFKLTGKDPVAVYRLMYQGAFGSTYGLSETVVKAIPLLITGLGVSLAFRMQLWNIGAEGQFAMGTFGATWMALTFPDWPPYLLLPLMLVMGFLLGGLWGLIPAIPRAYFRVNETISTLLLNYVALLWVDYFIYGPWRDPSGFNFPLTVPFTAGAILPAFGKTRIHAGLVIGLAIALILYIVLKYTKWGYEIRVCGESSKAAAYAGMNFTRNILLVMLISGGIAGIAGMTEVSAIAQRLQRGISPGYGYTAIIIAWLGRLNPGAIVVVSFLFGALLVGGFSIQTSGFPAATVSMLQGAILFFVLGGEIFTQYRIKRKERR
jgi:ABC-type uncharacterized transport system permease subunit